MKTLKIAFILFMLFFFYPLISYSEPIVTTFAGNGKPGYADGQGDKAQFNVPIRLACDRDGNIIVSDIFNNCIRRVTPEGVVSTVAGTKEGGYVDGGIKDARFGAPHGVGADSKGNIYVCDLSSSTIRKISFDIKEVSTFAGSGKPGYKDGKNQEAEFSFPHAVAVDKNDNLFIADISNHCIRKITPEGVVTTFAGSREKGFLDGDAKSAKFNMPIDVAVDRDGNVYVVDIGNLKIRKITLDGKVSTVAGNGKVGHVDGKANDAQFNGPHGIAIDKKGNVIIAELYNFDVRIISPDGVVTTLCGDGKKGDADGKGEKAQFNQPGGATIDKEGNVIIADLYNHKIKKITFK